MAEINKEIDIKDTLTINVKIKSLNNYKILFQKLKRAARYAVRHKIPLEIEIVENGGLNEQR